MSEDKPTTPQQPQPEEASNAISCKEAAKNLCDKGIVTGDK